MQTNPLSQVRIYRTFNLMKQRKKYFLFYFLLSGLMFAVLMAVIYYLLGEPQSWILFVFHFLAFGAGMTLFHGWQERRKVDA
jgi:hypothetical protein